MKKLFYFTIISILFTTRSYTQSIKGVIRDDKGVSIEAASISVKGTSIFRIADAKGEFTIPTPKTLPFTIIVTSVGFSPAEAEITELKDSVITIILFTNTELTELVITARRRVETAQNVPIPITVVGGAQVEETGAFNVNRLKELVPTVQLYSSNPRNTSIRSMSIKSSVVAAGLA